MEVFHDLNAWIWNEYLWLPPNITWEQISDTSTVNYAQFSDLHFSFQIAVALLFVRYILDQYLYSPLGIYLGIKQKTPPKIENAILERAYSKNKKIAYEQIQGLAKQLDWSERKVERWIRRKNSQGKPSALSKFTESAWRFTFYACSFSYGLYTLWDKPWLCTSDSSWYNYPHHSVTNDIWWYYMLELGFYWSLCISQFMDTKRKDFFQMFVHHIVTIMLLTLSWTSNHFRIGSLVLVIHDLADVPLEAGKMAKYAKKESAANFCFVAFVVAWIISRLIFYPYRILYSTMYKAPNILLLGPCFYACYLLLCSLQVMHIFWTWMIIKAATQALSSKTLEVKDVRSDSAESGSSDGENDVKGVLNEDNHDSNCTQRAF